MTQSVIEAFITENINTVTMTKTLAKQYNIRIGLDHGVLVPMWFIDQEYDAYDIVHITPGFTPLSQNYYIGQILGKTIKDYEKITGQRVLVLVSGDLSHALKDSGPYDYHPDGPEFDRIIQDSMYKKTVKQLLSMDMDFIDNAAQCGLRPYLIGFGVLDEKIYTSDILSYEGPFGVGYLTGYMSDSINNNFDIAEDEYIRLARKSVEYYVKTRRKYSLDTQDFSREFIESARTKRAGVFVSIHKLGNLRGCIGTIQAVNENLIEEIIYNGISACSADPRFHPITEDELSDLEIKVDVLLPIEPIQSQDALDIDLYGVIVEQGRKRGLLLPHLEGIETVDEQIRIVKQKAGIQEGPYALFRFKVERHE